MDLSAIVPDISNTTIRGPEAVTAALNDPGPESLRLVTRRMAPPRPAIVFAPKPSAPGNTGRANAELVTVNPNIRLGSQAQICFSDFIIPPYGKSYSPEVQGTTEIIAREAFYIEIILRNGLNTLEFKHDRLNLSPKILMFCEMVDVTGIEPATPNMPCSCSPN